MRPPRAWLREPTSWLTARMGQPDVILIGTGSEVSLCVAAYEQLKSNGIKARVVSMPSWELFEQQDQAYRDRVLPPAVTARVAVEQASTFGWAHYVGTHRHHHRHDDIRGLGSTERIAEGVWLHEGAYCRSRHAATEISEVVAGTRETVAMRSKMHSSRQATGNSSPLGATVVNGGVNFSLYSREATGMELLFFDRPDDAKPSRVIALDPASNRTYHYWHVFVPGARPGQIYGYRAQGAFDPANGMRFDSAKVLLDPYGRGIVMPKHYSRIVASDEGDNAETAVKSVIVDPSAYDWEGDAPLRRPSARTIVYEMHVRGFTRHPSSGVAEKVRGTYAGLIEKIPYLQQLGITAVELLPVFQFDPQDCPPGKTNYWGYAPISFFAPHEAYSSRQDPIGPVDEFRDMVKALHRAGIEVILDVVFNHTAEGDHRGPTLSFRGLDNNTYYILEQDRSRYANYTGTGNTLNGNHPIVRRMIVDSLRYWVEEMHVDGFRFDLASILARDRVGAGDGEPAGLVGYRVGPVTCRHQGHCRGMGRSRTLPGRQLHRRQLERMERPVPRRRPQLLPR